VRPEQIVEATLFASQTPLTTAELSRADDELTSGLVSEAIQALREAYEAEERSFQIYELGDGYQILTRPEFASYLERFDSVPRSPYLSGAALETLAIVAYRQPIGRIEIEEVRGVGASSVLRTLTDWELVEVVGRGEGLGRPLLYGTTRRFLEHFGLRDLDELPSPEELPVVLSGLEVDAVDVPGDASEAGA
jgi:segregation and condensation protein B